MKKLYLKDIAKSLGVSKTTVSLVLNNKGDDSKISLNTQKRILDFVKKNNYKPNQLARGLSRGKTETIGLIIPNISNIFYAMIAGYIETKAKEYGYTVVFSSSNENPKDEEKLIQAMLNRQVDGLIIATTQQNQKDIKELLSINFPFVLIDRHYPEIQTNYVVVDNYGGVKKATEHLLNLGKKRIGFVSLKSSLEALIQRFYGYKDALLNYNIKTDHIKELSPENYDEEMESAINELLQYPNNIDAIVFSTHYLAALGLRELKNKNIDIPKDVAIISFDELGAFDLVDPPITSVLQPVNSIGSHAVEILINKIENKDAKKHYTKVLKTELKIRKSCGSV